MGETNDRAAEEQSPLYSLKGITLPAAFEVLNGLGEGAHGIVLKAVFKTLDRVVALKVLKSDRSPDMPKQVERIEREARILARLKHPNIVQIFQVGFCSDGRPFIVFEYLEGLTLERYLAGKGTLTREQILSVFSQVLDALQYAHENSLLHRDLKPSNIMLIFEKESSAIQEAKILDFGIAREIELLDENNGLTRTSMLSGTPAYMSPEQCRAETLQAQSDLYSLACVVFECVFGRVPYDGESPMAVQYKHIHEPVESLFPDNVKRQNKKLYELLKKALSKDAELRHKNAACFKAELIDALESANRRSRTPLVIAAGVVFFVAVMAIHICQNSRLLKVADNSGGKTRIGSFRVSIVAEAKALSEQFYIEIMKTSPDKDKLLQMLKQADGLIVRSNNNPGLNFACLTIKSKIMESLKAPIKVQFACMDAAIDCCKSANGRYLYEAAQCFHAKARLAGSKQQYLEERDLLNKAYEIHEKLNGGINEADHLEIPPLIRKYVVDPENDWPILSDMAVNAGKMNEFEKAIYYDEKAAELMMPAWGIAGSIIPNLHKAEMLSRLRRGREAEEFAMAQFEMLRQFNPLTDAGLVWKERAIRNVATWFYGRGDLENCKRAIECSLNGKESSVPELLQIRRILGNALTELKQTGIIKDWESARSSSLAACKNGK